jgi:hypothetical protein
MAALRHTLVKLVILAETAIFDGLLKLRLAGA